MALDHTTHKNTPEIDLTVSTTDEKVIEMRGLAQNPNTSSIYSPLLLTAQRADSQWILQEQKEISDRDYQEIKNRVLQDLSALPHAYHNAGHTLSVLKRVKALGEHASLEPAQARLLHLAALCHDYGHAGTTYRQMLAEVDRNDLSNEEYAAVKADEILAVYLSVPQRVQLQGMILATTFGQQNAASIPDPSLLRDYNPTTKLEKLLAFADINSLEDSMDDWMQENFSVLEESATIPSGQQFSEYLQGRLGFLDYMQTKLDEVAPFLSNEYREDLDKALQERRNAVTQMLDENSPLKEKYHKHFSTILQKLTE